MVSESKSRARELAAQLKAEQARRERRRRTTLIGVVALAAVLVIGGLTALGLRSEHKASPTPTSTAIAGLKTYTGLSRNHVTTPVTYPQNPPVGGEHSPVWQNCGWYSGTVHNENAVHSMEHGAVWVTYSPSLSTADKAKLKSALSGHPYVVASEYPGLPAPVVASAWGAQVLLTGVDDPRLQQFVAAYAGSPNAPEPGGECSGGTGTPS